jgi:hypothetical protein
MKDALIQPALTLGWVEAGDGGLGVGVRDLRVRTIISFVIHWGY